MEVLVARFSAKPMNRWHGEEKSTELLFSNFSPGVKSLWSCLIKLKKDLAKNRLIADSKCCAVSPMAQLLPRSNHPSAFLC